MEALGGADEEREALEELLRPFDNLAHVFIEVQAIIDHHSQQPKVFAELDRLTFHADVSPGRFGGERQRPCFSRVEVKLDLPSPLTSGLKGCS